MPLNKHYTVIVLFLWMISPGCQIRAEQESIPVKVGGEILLEHYLQELEGKRVGLIMNPGSRIGEVHMLDTLLSRGVEIKALFSPEHGFRGNYGAGEIIENGRDQATGLPVYSLYAPHKGPTPDMLADLDILIFDMQDVGARFYTYISTMKYSMEAAARQSIEFWILDRPNPAGGDYVAGWVMEEKHESFVGLYPIPVAHGMTVGELASMAVGEGWLNSEAPELRIIPMKGWKRSMTWLDTGLNWIPTSPNLPAFENAYLYLGTCFIEGTSLSEGRGTPDPFLLLGHPELDDQQLDLEALSSTYHTVIDRAEFVPESIPGKAANPKHEGLVNYGVKLSAYKQDGTLIDDPVRFGVDLMRVLMKATPAAGYDDFLLLLSGSDAILNEGPVNWEEEVQQFRMQRAPYLLYD